MDDEGKLAKSSEMQEAEWRDAAFKIVCKKKCEIQKCMMKKYPTHPPKKCTKHRAEFDYILYI